jgi:hypothetical protein
VHSETSLLMHHLFFTFLSGWIAALSTLQSLATTPFLQASWADLLSLRPYRSSTKIITDICTYDVTLAALHYINGTANISQGIGPSLHAGPRSIWLYTPISDHSDFIEYYQTAPSLQTRTTITLHLGHSW